MAAAEHDAPAVTGRTTSDPARGDGVVDEVVDVVVVGFGAAGSVAAVEAAEAGARVVALDRWGRGGASARSGGIVYAGGGTPQQERAGFHDDVDQLATYLALEEERDPDDPRVRRFAARSAEHLAWLVAHGVRFADDFDPAKSVVPPGDSVGLYFSGNERHFADRTPAVPRGHRVAGQGMTGHDLIAGLHAAARAAGVDVRDRARAVDLVVEDGRVVGVEVLALPDRRWVRAVHTVLYRSIDLTAPLLRRVPGPLTRTLDAFERRVGTVSRVRARRGVVLATGGFSFDHRAMAERAPAFAGAMPLGTPGDDGSGIDLAVGVGAAVADVDHCGASRFIAPPVAFCRGVLVDAAGERICDESLYAATLSARIADHGGRGWLVVDAATRREVWSQIRGAVRISSRGGRELLSGRANHVVFPRLFGSINLFVNRRSATTLAELAERCGIDPAGLAATIASYNELATAGGPDPLGKSAEHLVAQVEPPYVAVPLHLDGRWFPAPCITLGGLSTDGATQQVRRGDGSTVPGLYAVGRCAAGVASRSYVSGLSLADCVHSGRTAGASVVAAVVPPTAGMPPVEVSLGR